MFCDLAVLGKRKATPPAADVSVPNGNNIKGKGKKATTPLSEIATEAPPAAKRTKHAPVKAAANTLDPAEASDKAPSGSKKRKKAGEALDSVTSAPPSVPAPKGKQPRSATAPASTSVAAPAPRTRPSSTASATAATAPSRGAQASSGGKQTERSSSNNSSKGNKGEAKFEALVAQYKKSLFGGETLKTASKRWYE